MPPPPSRACPARMRACAPAYVVSVCACVFRAACTHSRTRAAKRPSRCCKRFTTLRSAPKCSRSAPGLRAGGGHAGRAGWVRFRLNARVKIRRPLAIAPLCVPKETRVGKLVRQMQRMPADKDKWGLLEMSKKILEKWNRTRAPPRRRAAAGATSKGRTHARVRPNGRGSPPPGYVDALGKEMQRDRDAAAAPASSSAPEAPPAAVPVAASSIPAPSESDAPATSHSDTPATAHETPTPSAPEATPAAGPAPLALAADASA